MSEERRFLIWAVDDNHANLAMIAASLPADASAWLELRPFFDVRQFLAEHSRCCALGPAALPDFILLDFFLRYVYGWQALRQMRAEYAAAALRPDQRPVVIGHSSWPNASAMLVRQGADFALEKLKGQPRSAALVRNFAHPAALEQMRRTRRPFAEPES